MNNQIFQQRFMKVISTFGSKNYSAERISLIFDEVKFLSISDLEKLINHMVGNHRLAPLLSDFKKAIADMGLRAERKQDIETTFSTPKGEEDFLYHLRDHYWADNKYIHVRGNGKSVRDCSFVIKSDHPGHPLVIEDCNVRESKIKEAKLHLVKGTYAKFEQSKINDMRRVNYDDFSPEPA